MRISSLAVASLAAALVIGAVAAPPAHAQLTRGIAGGTVRDATGAVLPGATVTITHRDTGITRTAVTSMLGTYRVGALEPGVYAVRIELDGFKTVEHPDVEVPTAQEVTIDASLDVASLAETVEVTANPAGARLNRANPTIGMTASAQQATDLPLSPERDVNRLALLSPNVFAAPAGSGLSANGQRSRHNNFAIDGSDNNDITISTPTLPVVPEAVAEFQVQTNPYNVEFGRNSGAQVNVITKSGTNDLRGEIFEYYRGSELSSLNNIEKSNGLSDPGRFNRNQFGAGVGGPVVRGRMFFYGLFQGDRTRSANALGTTVRIPTPAGFAALGGVPLGAGQSAASRQAVLDRLAFLQSVYAASPVFRSVQPALVNGVPIETGQTNVGRPTPNDTSNVLGRADVQLSSRDTLTVRYLMNRIADQNVFGNVEFAELFAAGQNVLDQNLAVSHARVFSAQLLNEVRLSHVRRDLEFPENDPVSPTATIAGFFTVGGASLYPQGRQQDSLQLSDVLTSQWGRHAVKVGTDIRYIRLDNLAAFDSKGTFAFNSLQDFVNNRAASYRQALQTASFEADQWQLFLFAQDDVKVRPDLTINLGLRYEASSVPLGFFGATQPEVRDALVPGPVQRDTNNVAPRIGAAWSPSPNGGLGRVLFGDGRGVLRGGYGIAYDVLFYNLMVLTANNYPRVVVGEIGNAFDVYPNTASVSGAPVFSPMAVFRNVPENAELPASQYWSLSLQREVGDQTTVEVGYTGSLARHGLVQMQANPSRLTAEQAATVRATGNAFAIPSVQARREYPQIGSRILYATEGTSEYHAGFARFDRRFHRGLQFGAAYTIGRLMSDSDEALGVPDIVTGSPQVPQAYDRLDEEWSLSAFDRTHRLAVHWIYEVPAFGSRALDAVAGGWRIAGVFQGQSGQPFTVLTGVDSNGNGAGGDRPNYDPAGRLVPDPVTGNLRTFTTAGMFVAPTGPNGVPLANSLGNGSLGRNTLRAPAVFNWDLSVAKRFRLRGAHALTIRADVLNAFNQDNYGIPINAMNNLSFGQNANNWGNRSVTLSAKYAF